MIRALLLVSLVRLNSAMLSPSAPFVSLFGNAVVIVF